VTFEVNDPNLVLTATERAELEYQFVDACNAANALNEANCDLLFREADTVDLILIHAVAANQKKYKSFVRGTCRGCSEATSIFDPGRRLLLTSNRETRWMQSKERQMQEECFCPVGNPEQRGPTKEEFFFAYNEVASVTVIAVDDA